MQRFMLWCLAVGFTVAAPAVGSQESPSGTYEARGITLTISATRAVFTSVRGTLVDAALKFDGSRLTMRDSAGAVACLGVAGEYEWRRNGDTLRFRAISDSCDGRRGAMSSVWTRVAGAFVLTGVSLIDGTGTAPQHNMTIVMRNGRVEAIHRDGQAAIPADATVRDMRGHWVTPGLIDAHVHVATNPSAQDRRDRTERRLRNALRGGVVAVRDMAGDARALADLARAAAAGDIEAPLIRYTALFAGPSFFGDPRVRASSVGYAPGSAPWARAITDTSDLRQLVAEARGTGATAIKLYAALDSATVALISTEARRQNLGVWSHLSLIPARPSHVVGGGAQVVSHATLLAWEASADLPGYERRAEIDYSVTGSHAAVQRVLTLMRERNVMFEPTLFVFRAGPSASDTSTARKREQSAFEMTRAAYAAGVRIVAGTDGMGSDTDGAMPNVHEELRLLVDGAGLSTMDAVLAGTRNAAEAMGIGATHGTVAVGKAADLLVLRANPLDDIRNTREIAMVLRRGLPVGGAGTH